MKAHAIRWSGKLAGGLALVLMLLASPAAAFADYPDILYYRFNEGSGNQTENVAIPGQGASQGSFVGTVNWIPGQFGNAIDTLSGGYVESGWNTELDQSLTIETWLRTTSTTWHNYYAGDNSHSSFRMRVYNGNRIWVSGGGFGSLLSGIGPTLNDGQWHHVAFVYDDDTNTVRVYINGSLQSTWTGIDPDSGPSSGTLKVGAYTSTFNAFEGDLDEFRIWREARSQAEIQATMNDQLGYLLFENVSDNRVYGASGSDVPVGAFEANVLDSVTLQARSDIAGASIDISSVASSNEDNVSNVDVTPSSATGISTTNPEDFVVEFMPDSDGAFSFTLAFTHNHGSVPSPFELNLEGYAGPWAQVEDGNGIVIPAGETYESETRFSSGNTNTWTFEIHSAGTADLDVSAITTGNENGVTVHSVSPSDFTGGNELAPQTHGTVSVGFTPDVGSFSFDVTVSSNDVDQPNYTYTFEALAGLNGSYTINNDPGAGADYQDIGDAISDLHDFGVAAPVVFEIFDDGSGYTSNSNYVFGEIPDASATNTITFRAAPGEQPRIIGAGASTGYTSRFASQTAIAFQNLASDITLQGIEFDLDGGPHGITFYSSSSGDLITRIVIERCRFHGGDGAAIGAVAFSNRLDDVLIRNNWFWNNQGNEHGSISSTRSRGTLYFYRAEGFVVEHNTVVAPSDYPAVWYNNFSSRYVERFVNNVVVYLGSSNALVDDASTDIEYVDGNLYWAPNASQFHSNHATFGDWVGAGFDANGLYADPFMLDPAGGDLRLAIDSPAKNFAQEVIVNRDIFGLFRPIGLGADVGAEEIAPSEPAISVRKHGQRPAFGGNVELERLGEQVAMQYTVEIINERGGTLTLADPAVDVVGTTDATAAILNQPAELELGMGERTSFVIEITATGAVGQDATVDLEIDSDDPAHQPFEFTLEGEILTPEPWAHLERDEEGILSGATDHLDAPIALEREHEIVYTIRNIGSDILNLTGSPLVEISNASGLASTPIVSTTPGSTILAQADASFTVTLEPESEYFSFDVYIETDDPEASRADYAFTVEGVAGPMPEAVLVEQTIDFGSARAETGREQRSVVVHNDGLGELLITSLALDDPTSSWRLISSNPPIPSFGTKITLDPQGGELDQLEMVFEFAPQEPHSDLIGATLTIGTNDTANPELAVEFVGEARPRSVDSPSDDGCALGSSPHGGIFWILALLAALLVAMRWRSSIQLNTSAS